MKKRITRIYFILLLLSPMLVCAQKKTFFSLGGEIAFPAGNYSDVGNTGFGGIIGLEHVRSKHVSGIVTLEYLGFSTKEVNTDFTEKYSALPVQFGVKYYLSENTGNPRGLYFSGGLGFLLEFTTTNIGVNAYHNTYHDTDFGFCGFVGTGYQLGIVDLGFRFQNFITSNTGATFYYSFRVAVRINN